MSGKRSDGAGESGTIALLQAQQHATARPDRGQAYDGKAGGQVHRGQPGKRAGAKETERRAPGTSTGPGIAKP